MRPGRQIVCDRGSAGLRNLGHRHAGRRERKLSMSSIDKEMVMKANVGSLDRMLRIVVGIGLLALFFVLEGSARYLGLIGLVPLATGLFRFCPAYALFGLSTCPMERRGA